MKTMILAATAVLALGVGSAFAGDGDDATNNGWSPLASNMIVAAQPQQAQVATAQSPSGSTLAFATLHRGSVSVFPVNTNEGANN